MSLRRRVLLGLATTGLLGLTGWAVAASWQPAGLPLEPFRAGLGGHPPDPWAWPRLFAWGLPSLYGACALLHRWLATGRPGIPQRLDAWSHVALPGFVALEWLVGGREGWALWLGAAYLGLLVVKVTLLALAAVRGERGRTPRAAGWAVLAVSLVAFAWTSAYVVVAVSTTGDEPYYLLVAHSLVRDHDLDLADEFRTRAYLPFYWGSLWSGQNTIHTAGGALYSVTYSGLLAFLLAPGYLLAGRLGATLTISLLAALLAQQVLWLAWETTGHRRTAFLTWTAVAFTSPVALFASQLYPEIPAALALAVAVRSIRRLPGASAGHLVRLAIAVVVLPLLKLRLALLGAGLAAWGLLRLRRGRWLGWALAGTVGLAAACLLADYLLGGLLYARYLARLPLGAILVPTHWMPARLLGLLLDQEFGLLPYAPVYALAATGLVPALRREPSTSPLLLIGALYTYPFLHSPDWYGGFSLPFRYFVVLVPVLAILVAHGLATVRGRLGWSLVAAAGLFSLAVAAGLTLAPLLRYNDAIGRARWLAALGHGLAADLPRLVPSAVNPSPETLPAALVALGLLAALAAGGARAVTRAVLPEGPPGVTVGQALGGGAALVALGLITALVVARALPTVEIQGEHMTVDGPGVLFPGSDALPLKAWVLRGPGRLSAPVTLRPGATRLTIHAGGFTTDGVAPRLEVRLDGVPVGALDVPAGSGAWRLSAQVLVVPAAPGHHRLTLICPNALDDRVGGHVRHLLIDRVRIDPVS